MTKAKHTPGPYRVDDSFFKMGYFFRIQSPSGQIAEISQRDDKDEELANANLIAAAPDLLAALEAFEWIPVPLDGSAYLVICPWCNANKLDGHKADCPRQTAIAKAKGE